MFYFNIACMTERGAAGQRKTTSCVILFPCNFVLKEVFAKGIIPFPVVKQHFNSPKSALAAIDTSYYSNYFKVDNISVAIFT
jgi:hypothetical protein